MFVEGVLEEEVINIVNNFKSKTSIDVFGIDMAIIKNVISYVVKPFYIYM